MPQDPIILNNPLPATDTNRVLVETLSALVAAYPDHVRSCYLFGSHADDSSVAASDVDLCIVIRGTWTQDNQLVLDTMRESAYMSHGVSLDVIVLPETTLLEEGHFRIKSASRLVWGEDIRPLMPDLPFDVYLRRYSHAAFSYIGPVLRHATRVEYPLSYPDPAGEFFGYDQERLAPMNAPLRNVKGLVSAACWIATFFVGWKVGKTVGAKSESIPAYREHIGDTWTSYLEELYSLARGHWAYLIPDADSDRMRLRHLCARALALENHYMAGYREYLLSELRRGDSQAQADAIERLAEAVFTDLEVQEALRKAKM